jgi:hypothetical protein
MVKYFYNTGFLDACIDIYPILQFIYASIPFNVIGAAVEFESDYAE